MTAVFFRELLSYFISPMGYVYLAAFYVLAGYEYTVIILSGRADMSYEFTFLYTVILLLIPILTMRLMSEDRKQKTEQLLFSAPVSLSGITAGKYLSAVTVYFMGIAVTLLHAAALSPFTEMNWELVFGNFIGIMLMGMACISMCMFISAQTENQIVAAIGGFASVMVVLSLNSIAGLVSFEPLRKILYSFSFYSRYHDLTMGIFRAEDLFFFISFSCVFFLLTVTNLEKRRGRHNILTTGTSVLFIILAVTANSIVGKLAERYEWSVDLTEDGRYAISEDSINYLKDLKEDVSITVFVDEEDMASGSYYIVQAYHNLTEYERQSEKVELEFVDLVDHPAYASQYPTLEINAYDILVQTDDRQEVLALKDLFEYDSTGSEITASRVEQMVTNAVVSVTAEEKSKVTILTGYGELFPTDLKELLEVNGYAVTEQSLLTGEIDEEAQTAVLFAPQKDLEEDSLRKIRAWLDQDGRQGKNLFVFFDPNAAKLPGLEKYLNEWGIKTGEGYAFESNSNLYYNRFYYPVAQYMDMEYASDMTGSDLTIMALCRPVDVLFESKDNYETSILLGFSPTSGIIQSGDTEVTADKITGNVNGMVLSSHRYYGSEVTVSNVAVSGSALAFGKELLSSGTFANADYILGVFQKLGDVERLPGIVPKDLSAPVHTMTEARTNTYIWGFFIVLPALVMVTGVAVWLRRRHG